MQVVTDIRLLILLAVANTAPLLAKGILGSRFAMPLDGNLILPDGRSLFGSSKTIRGVLCAILATSALAPLLDMTVATGAVTGSAAMLGDLCSSFTKRRLGLVASSRATGLDQIPEALLPLLACRETLALGVIDIVVVAAAFMVGEILLSKLAFRLRLRDRPY
jgi:CDP-2,3-bis-(O-geranylgeranyl)-sn-glycerol synthase